MRKTEEPRRALYAEGLNDAEIAAIEGCSQYTIRNWRTRRGLPGNADHYLTAKDQKRRLLMRALGLGDSTMAKMLGLNKSTVTRWRRRTGQGPQECRVNSAGDSRSCGLFSLDEPTRTGGSKYEALADPRWSHWLEEAGATVW